jgi:hypothetical protein
MATKTNEFHAERDELSPPMRFGFAEREAFGRYLDTRLAEHKRWQHEVEYALIEEIIDEVQQLPARKPKSGRLFLELPKHMEARA